MICFRHEHSDSAGYLISTIPEAYKFNGLREVTRETTVIVNYGKFTGNEALVNNSHTPVINKTWAGDKLECLNKVKRVGIIVPEYSVPGNHIAFNSSWIIKPRHSARGQNIRTFCASETVDHHNEYLQRKIEHRCYELRVQCCLWVPKEKWCVIKRTNRNPQELVWNRDPDMELNKHIEESESNTGVFARAKEMAYKAMEALGYQFGAVDFIVARPPNHSGPLPIYFLEFNTEPCCIDTTKTKQYYQYIFNELNQMTKERIYTIVGETPVVSQPAPTVTPQPQPATTGGIKSQLEQILRTIKSINDAQIGQISTLVNQSSTNLQRIINLF